ncbi:MAG: hypothetical protein IKO00_17330 [Oscillospiraceae bacterium]|nr:hypothetical protein [Oscillospiraceae bacterium]
MLDPDVTEILDDPEVGGGVSFLVRRPKETRVKGSVELTYEEIHATGNIQPAEKSATQGVNEDQLNEQIVIRTTTVLQAGTRNETGVYHADEVFYKGFRWRVLRVENWEDWGFVTAYATRTRE